jgi:hypothetical protein
MLYANQSAHDIKDVYNLSMDTWQYRINVACDIME